MIYYLLCVDMFICNKITFVDVNFIYINIINGYSL